MVRWAQTSKFGEKFPALEGLAIPCSRRRLEKQRGVDALLKRSPAGASVSHRQRHATLPVGHYVILESLCSLAGRCLLIIHPSFPAEASMLLKR